MYCRLFKMRPKKGKISIVVAMLLVLVTALLIIFIFGEPINKAFAAVTDPLLKKIGLEEDGSGQQAPQPQLAPCPAPTVVSCYYNLGSNTIQLLWNGVSGATNYKMEWARKDLEYGDQTAITGETWRITSSTSGYTSGLLRRTGRTVTEYKLHTRVESGNTCTAPSSWSVECY